MEPLTTLRPITQQNLAVLNFIREHIVARGFAPTRAEIATRFDWWPNAVTQVLASLQRSGVIRVVPRKHRGIELTSS